MLFISTCNLLRAPDGGVQYNKCITKWWKRAHRALYTLLCTRDAVSQLRKPSRTTYKGGITKCFFESIRNLVPRILGSMQETI